jgi:hypothetical protein
VGEGGEEEGIQRILLGKMAQIGHISRKKIV